MLENYSAFDKPLTQADCLSKEEWIRYLYEFEPLKYISIVMPVKDNRADVIDIIKDMVLEMERVLKEVLNQFLNYLERITNHLRINNSKYCIIVSPRFSRGVRTDIKDFSIVTIEAETLANYFLKECLNSKDGLEDYDILDLHIEKNLGIDITNAVNYVINQKYSI